MKRFLCMALTLVMLCGLLGGCGIEVEEAQKDEKSSYSFYYLNAGETALKTEGYAPQEETAAFMVKDLMQRLGKKDKKGEEVNLLPQEVSINSYNLQEDLLVIDFNRQYQKMSRAREILVRVGIVKTFLQVPGIARVRFTVGGSDLMNSRNEKVGDMSADTFAEYSGTDMDAYRYDTFTLYFADKTGTMLVEEKRNVYYKRTLSKEKVVLEQLAKGPMVKGNYPTIPDSSRVLSVTTADRVCYVNMDSSFQEYALDISREVMVYSVVNSLLAACEADKVQISIEGKTGGEFGENLPVYSFYEKNEGLVAVSETSQES